MLIADYKRIKFKNSLSNVLGFSSKVSSNFQTLTWLLKQEQIRRLLLVLQHLCPNESLYICHTNLWSQRQYLDPWRRCWTYWPMLNYNFRHNEHFAHHWWRYWWKWSTWRLHIHHSCSRLLHHRLRMPKHKCCLSHCDPARWFVWFEKLIFS